MVVQGNGMPEAAVVEARGEGPGRDRRWFGLNGRTEGGEQRNG